MTNEESAADELMKTFGQHSWLIGSVAIVVTVVLLVDRVFCSFGRRQVIANSTEFLLKHCLTNHFLLTPNTPTPPMYVHERSSRQQQLVASHLYYDTWFFKTPPTLRLAGGAIYHGDLVHIVNKRTGLYLHSHSGHPSPVTQQQEVTLWPQEQDANNLWQILIEGEDRSKPLKSSIYEGKKIRLFHYMTKSYLHSHNERHPIFTSNFQEVTCYSQHDDQNNDWLLLIPK